MKKLAILAVLLIPLLLLSACHEGMINSSVSITSKDGAGTKTIYVDILKDEAPIPGNKDGATVGNNSKFLLGGGNALKSKLEAICKLDGVTITNEDKGQFERVTLSYSFNSIADYNAKMKKLADGKGTITDAVLTVDGDSVTFTEPASNAYNSVLWAIEAVYGDAALYDKTGKGDVANNPITIDQMAKIYDVEIAVNGTSKKVNLKDMPQTVDVSATGTIVGAPAVDTAPEKNENTDNSTPNTESAGNPKTADTAYPTTVIFAAIAMVALGTAVALRKKALPNK